MHTELSRRAGRRSKGRRLKETASYRSQSDVSHSSSRTEHALLSSQRQQIIVWLLWNTCIRDQKALILNFCFKTKKIGSCGKRASATKRYQFSKVFFLKVNFFWLLWNTCIRNKKALILKVLCILTLYRKYTKIYMRYHEIHQTLRGH
jgi:hypothetical protein